MMFEVIKGTGSGERTTLMETRRSLSAPYNRQTDHEMKGTARSVDLQCLVEIAPIVYCLGYLLGRESFPLN